MFAARLGGKFTEFPGLAKYVAMLKVSCTKVPCAHIGCTDANVDALRHSSFDLLQPACLNFCSMLQDAHAGSMVTLMPVHVSPSSVSVLGTVFIASDNATQERPSFQKSWPPHWKESTGQDWLEI